MSNSALVEALKQKFKQVKGQGDWLRIPCPTCAPHNRSKMKRYVPAHGFTSNCFICGIKQDVSFLLGADYYPSQVDTADFEDTDTQEVDPRALVLPYSSAIPINQLSQDHPAVKFLAVDHLTDLDAYANIHKIVYVPYEGGMTFINSHRTYITSAERLVFPVFFEQQLAGWQMRSLPGTFYGDKDGDIRYYHVFNKGSYLYNYDQAKNHKRVIVVEGVKKALKFPNGVATWGSGISRKQLKLIQKWDEIVMMLDSDEGNNTQQRARGFVESINAGAGKIKAINVDLDQYGHSSPDDLPSSVLNMIIEEQWNAQTHNTHR